MDSPPPTPPTPPPAPPPPSPRSSDSKPLPQRITAGPNGALPGVRRFPKPPPLLPRIVMLLIRPESWAEAARYRTHVTIIPLLLVVLVGSIAVGVSGSNQIYQSLYSFAASYDAQYPPLYLSGNGTLSLTPPSASTVPAASTSPATVAAAVSTAPAIASAGSTPPPSPTPPASTEPAATLKEPIQYRTLEDEFILVDPTGKTVPETLRNPVRMLITDREAILLSGTSEGPVGRVKLSTLCAAGLVPRDQTKTINSTTMTSFLANQKSLLMVMWAASISMVRIVADLLWSALIMFLICPVVILATAGPRLNPEGPDRRLLLPRRAAYRIAAAVLVPILALDAGLHAAHHPVSSLLGGQGASLFWFFSAGALALWAGLMARRMYTPRENRRST